MKLLLDQGLPADAAGLLREAGYECLHVSEIHLQRAADEAILGRAGADGSVIVTLDADFHTLVAVQGLRSPSVIRLRKEGCRAEEAAVIVADTVRRCFEPLRARCLISVKDRRTSIHRLPIGAGE